MSKSHLIPTEFLLFYIAWDTHLISSNQDFDLENKLKITIRRVNDHAATMCMEIRTNMYSTARFILTSLYPRGQIICSRSVWRHVKRPIPLPNVTINTR